MKNIFLNGINKAITSDNIVTDISDHQFLVTLIVLENKRNKMIHKRCLKKFNESPFCK